MGDAHAASHAGRHIDTGESIVHRNRPELANISALPTAGAQVAVKELKDFCRRMDRHFEESNLTVEEADRFYALLRGNNETMLPGGQFLFFPNGTYGMPGPERPDPFVFEEQVRVKKLDERKYEIFYYYIDCGRRYDYMEVYLEDGALIGYNVLETWAESFLSLLTELIRATRALRGTVENETSYHCQGHVHISNTCDVPFV